MILSLAEYVKINIVWCVRGCEFQHGHGHYPRTATYFLQNENVNIKAHSSSKHLHAFAFILLRCLQCFPEINIAKLKKQTNNKKKHLKIY